MPPILVFDTFSVFFRAFHALPPMNTRAGQPTSAVYGMSVLLLKLLREQNPKGLCFARDRPEPTFRHQQYVDYKAQRAPLPEPLVSQFALLDRLLDAFGAPVFGVSGFEADDVIATLARGFAGDGEHVCVISGDRDLFQVVREHVHVLFIGRRGQPHVLYDEAAIAQRFALRPEQLPSFVALVGDTADNIPGVHGIGDKTAQKLIAQFGTASALLDGLEQVKSSAVRAALSQATERIRQNESLARLHSDVPLPKGARYSAFTADAKAALRAFFEELEFQSLLPRLDKLATR
ncbi:MAG TPA: 5'-3' exonuclease H3TH domain-containing protein [Polyangiales bacterium]|nr:5'-3' exonuclease H3TH domain-containing protein [Polyangiales bacterium]